MKSTNSCDLEIGNSEIAIKIYSAVEGETHFKQISTCCNSPVSYLKVCSECRKELSQEEIKKAIELGDELKQVDSEAVKVETTNLKILGIISNENEENGLIRDGLVWFIGFETDKKNKGKNERNLTKFSYLREAVRKSGKSLIGLINVRGKEHIILVKPYFKGLIGLGLYHFDRVRDIQEISGYSEAINIDETMLNTMSQNISQKQEVAINQIENTRNKLIELAITKTEMGDKLNYAGKEENLLELCAF
jgi:DNA end-binding protein Ku